MASNSVNSITNLRSDYKQETSPGTHSVNDKHMFNCKRQGIDANSECPRVLSLLHIAVHV